MCAPINPENNTGHERKDRLGKQLLRGMRETFTGFTDGYGGEDVSEYQGTHRAPGPQAIASRFGNTVHTSRRVQPPTATYLLYVVVAFINRAISRTFARLWQRHSDACASMNVFCGAEEELCQ